MNLIIAAGVATLLNLQTGEIETIQYEGDRAYNATTGEFYTITGEDQAINLNTGELRSWNREGDNVYDWSRQRFYQPIED